MAVLYVQIVFPSVGANGRSLALAPVATITCFAFNNSFPLLLSTATDVAPTSFPHPCEQKSVLFHEVTNPLV